MHFLHNIPIKHKVTIIAMLASGVALLLACAAFVAYERLTFQQSLVRDFAVLADMFDESIAPGLAFNDGKALEQTLKTLSAHPHILAAAVYNEDGQIVATYLRPDSAGFTPPSMPGKGSSFQRDHLDTFQKVVLDGEEIGTVYIAADLLEIQERQQRYIFITGLVLLASSFAAFSLSSHLRRIISEPVSHLAHVAHQVAVERNYSLRAVKQSNDELGRLIGGFNEMLAQIQDRDSALQAARNNLEKRVEARTRELASSVSLLNATIDSTEDGILAIQFLGDVACYNSKFAAMWRIPPALLEKKTPHEIRMLLASRTRNPEAFIQKIRDFRNSSQIQAFDVIELVDGRIFERYVKPQLIEGQSVGVVINFRDVTERKQSEEKLTLLATALSSIEEGILILEARADGQPPKIVFANEGQARIAGYSLSELLGRSLTVFNGPKTDLRIFDGMMQAILKRKESFTGELINYRKDGTEYFADLHVSPVLNAMGLATHFICHQRDVTARKNREAIEAQSQKMESIGQLASGIAHEINSPMQFLGTNVQFLQDGFKSLQTILSAYRAKVAQSQPGIPEDLQLMENSVDLPYLQEEIPLAIDQSIQGLARVSQLVSAMKKFSHPGHTDKKLCDLNEGIEATATISRNEWKYVAELVTELDPKLPRTLCSIDEINQVVLNMIVNATHSIKDAIDQKLIQKGLIIIRTRLQDSHAVISLQDNGTGIPPSILNRIYDPFFTTKEVGRGTGQGLAISHDIVVKKHKGRIEVKSEPGRGACFFIFLPLSSYENALS